MTTYFAINDNEVDIVGSGNAIKSELPLGTYVVKNAPMRGFYLEKVDDFDLPKKIYGNAESRADRIINTFRDRSSSTGVLLQGEKGSGKTLLAKQISIALRKSNQSTIIVNTPFCGDEFNTFVQQLKTECLILFDEFEKTYDRDKQSEILTLLDGVIQHKKLFIFTINDAFGVNRYMINRPGRLFYRYTYSGLDEVFIREYAGDNLKNKNHLEGLVVIAKSFIDFNFDMLKAIIEDMNRYNETAREVVEHLNVDPGKDNTAIYEVGSFEWYDHSGIDAIEIKNITASDINYSNPFNPYSSTFPFKVQYDALCDEDANDLDKWSNEYDYLSCSPDDIVLMKDGVLFYNTGKFKLAIRRKISKTNSIFDVLAL